MDNLGGTREAPEGRKGLIGGQGGTREAGKDQIDSLEGAKEAAGRQERNNWTPGDTREARKE